MSELVERNAAVRREYAEGTADWRLAERYGVSRQRIHQIIGKDLTAVRRATRQTKEQAEAEERDRVRKAQIAALEVKLFEAVRLVARGMSVRGASQVKKVPLSALYASLEEAGIKTRYGRWRDRTELKMTVETLIANGEVISQIPERVATMGDQVSEGWIYRHCYPAILARRAANDNSTSKVAA